MNYYKYPLMLAAALLFVCGGAGSLQAQNSGHRFKQAAALPKKAGVQPIMVEVNGPSDPVIRFTYTLPEAGIIATGQRFGTADLSEIRLGNALQSDNEGEPVLPVIPARFVIPAGYSLENVTVVASTVNELRGVYRIRHGEAKIPFVNGVKPRKATPKNSIYGSDNPYPGKTVEVVGVYKKRGVSIAVIKIHPVLYRPRTGRISWLQSVSLELKTKKEGTDKKIRSRPGMLNEPSLQVENPEALGTYEEGSDVPSDSGSVAPLGSICDPASSYRYVIVTPDSIRTATTDYTVRDLVARKQARGISATIVTMENVIANYSGVDNAERLRNFIIDAYNNWETDFVLLGGDINMVPMRKLYCVASSEVDQIPSDLYYQCLDGTFNSDNDGYWGETTDGPGGGDVDLMAEIYIGRASAENKSEMSNFVYKTLAYENAAESSPYLRKALMAGEYLGFGGVSDYATATMEEIRLGSSASGYTTAGFASCPLFSVDSLYDSPTYTWPASEMLGRMNSGTYAIYNHLGHANYNYNMKFYNADADALTNNNFFFAYSQGCIPGNFETDCLAEHLTTSNRHGAYAVVFNARYGWGQFNSTDGPSQRFNRQFWDAYFGEFMSNLGALNADSHEDNIWDINGDCIRWCFYETNLLGDPQTAVRGRVTGPSLAYASHTLNDASGGNGDGLVNPGETIDILLSVANLGTDSAAGVTATVSSGDPYVTMVNGGATFGAVPCCGATKPAAGPVRLGISSSCPTPHTITLSCLLKDARDSTWSSTFTITAYTSSQVGGYVRTLTGGAPVSGATVSFSGPVSGSVVTNAQGAYMFGGIDGSYTVIAVASGYSASALQTIAIPPSVANVNFSLGRPQIAVTPPSITRTLLIGDSTTVPVSLQNNGDLPLFVSATADATTGTGVWAAPSVSYDSTHFVTIAKGETDTRLGNPQKLLRGGPDSLGYRWIDSREAGGPAYVWNDIAATGRQLSTVSGCDDCNEAVTLSFPFSFYGNTFSSFYVGSNGYITFGTPASQYSNYPLPSTSMPANLIAGFFDDLYPVTAGDIYFQDFGDRAIVQFNGVSIGSSSTYTCTFQIIMHRNGAINLYYKSITGSQTSCTVGIQNATQSVGLNVVYNATYLADSLAVEFRSTPAWVTVSPSGDTIDPGMTGIINVRLASVGLNGGMYSGALSMAHNAPGSASPFTVPCTLHVDGIRRLAVSPVTVDFGSCWVGLKDTAVLTLTNSGDEATVVSAVSSSNPCFTAITPLPLTVPAFGNAVLRVAYQPGSTGAHSGTLIVTSNAEDYPEIAVPCGGTGTLGPQITVTPLSFSRTLNAGDSTVGILKIKNTVGPGNGDLQFSIGMTAAGTTSSEMPALIPSVYRSYGTEGLTVSGDGKGMDLPAPGPLENQRFASADLRVLFACAIYDSTTVSSFVQGLRSLSNVSSVQVLQCLSSTPNVAYLQGFDIVVVASDYYWADTALMGNALADYVDAGGRVCLLNAPFCSGGSWALGGRIMRPEYSPFAVAPYGNGTVTSGTIANHAITEGVASISTGLYSYISALQGRGISLGTYSNGYQMAAYNPDKSIVVFNVFPENGYWGGDLLRMMGNTFDYLAGASWLSLSSKSDTLGPGDSATITVKFNAKAMMGGSYLETLSINHNATNETSPVSIPCELTVNGFRSLSVSPSSINFNSLWVGLRDTAFLSLVNSGSEATVVSSIASTDPAFAAAASLPLTIQPFATAVVPVVFLPASVGSYTGTLTIQSNAEDNPAIPVTCNGSGVSAPQISVTPSSLSRILNPGDSTTGILTLANSGGDTLRYHVSAEASALPLGPVTGTLRSYSFPLRTVTVPADPDRDSTGNLSRISVQPLTMLAADLTDVTIVYDRYHGERDSANESTLINDIKQRGARILVNNQPITSLLLDTVDILWIDDDGSLAFSPAESTVVVNWIKNGGGLFTHCDAPGFFQNVVQPFGIAFSGSCSAGTTTNITAHPITDSVFQVDLSGPMVSCVATGEAKIVVRDVGNYGHACIVEAGKGRIVTVTDDDFYNGEITYADNRKFGNNIIDWLADGKSRRWLSATPDTGMVVPGGQAEIAVKFVSTDLLGGTYTGAIKIVSNTPAGPSPYSVPCTLAVNGFRSISVSPSALSFGPIWAGLRDTGVITLSNGGNEATQVSSIISANPAFSADKAVPLIVPPYGSVTVPIVFAPSSAGIFSANLTISSDAEDHPALTVSLEGVCTLPPSIAVNPASISATLTPGQSRQETMTVQNSGDDILNYSVQVAGQGGNGDTIDILAWTPYTDMTGEWVNVQAALGQYLSRYTLTTSTSFDSTLLEAALASREVLLIPEQENGTIPSGTGTIFRGVLTRFLQRGGTIIYSCPGWSGNTTAFLAEASLMNLTSMGYSSSGAIGLTLPNDSLFAGVSGSLVMKDATSYCQVNDNSTILATYGGGMVIARRNLYNGRIITLGPDFYAYDSNWARILCNAVLTAKPAASWLSLSSHGGSLAPGGSFGVTITINAGNLDIGTYNAVISVAHNDPLRDSPVRIPVTLNVQEIVPGGRVGRITAIGASSLPASFGARYQIMDIRIGSAVAGVAQGARYAIRLSHSR